LPAKQRRPVMRMAAAMIPSINFFAVIGVMKKFDE
jgi:hypothetical protein